MSDAPMSDSRRRELLMSSPTGRAILSRRSAKNLRRPPPLSGSWDSGLRSAVGDVRQKLEEFELRSIPDSIDPAEANARLLQSKNDIKEICTNLIAKLDAMIL